MPFTPRLVFVTASNVEEARKLAQGILEKRDGFPGKRVYQPGDPTRCASAYPFDDQIIHTHEQVQPVAA